MRIPRPFHPPQILHAMAFDWTRAWIEQDWWLPTWAMAWSPYLHVQFIPLKLSNFNLYFMIPITDSSTNGSTAVWDLGRCIGLNTPEEAKISELKWWQQPLFAVYHWNSTWYLSPLAHMHTCGKHNCTQFIHNDWLTSWRNFDSRTHSLHNFLSKQHLFGAEGSTSGIP